MFFTLAMPRGDHVNIKITFNRNQNIPTGFIRATRCASVTPKDEVLVVKELFVMKLTHQTCFQQDNYIEIVQYFCPKEIAGLRTQSLNILQINQDGITGLNRKSTICCINFLADNPARKYRTQM
jgi:hypothetical protein